MFTHACHSACGLTVHAELGEVREALAAHAPLIAQMFAFYASTTLGKWRSSDMRKLDLERFRIMVADFDLVDARRPSCKSLNELDAVFVVWRTVLRRGSSCCIVSAVLRLLHPFVQYALRTLPSQPVICVLLP